MTLDHRCKYCYSDGTLLNAGAVHGDLTTWDNLVRLTINGSGGAGLATTHDDMSDQGLIEAAYNEGVLLPFGRNENGSLVGFYEDPLETIRHVGTLAANAHGVDRLMLRQSNPLIMHTISDKFWAFPTANAGALQAPVTACWTMQTSLLHVNPALFIDDPPLVRNKFKTTITENLLGFHGMNMFKPYRLYDDVNYLPPIIQDYSLVVQQTPLVKCETNEFDYIEITPESNYTIETRNVTLFNQTEKTLNKVDMQYPYFQRYESSSDTIEFQLSLGPPDEVFLYYERREVAGEAWTRYQPVIKTVKLELTYQSVKSVSEMDEKALFYATKRNSNFRCDTTYNRRYRGGVLLSSFDFENWGQWMQEKGMDNFLGKLQVLTSDEYDSAFQPGDDLATNLEQVGKKFTAVFIYHQHAFTGEIHNCRFWRTDVVKY